MGSGFSKMKKQAKMMQQQLQSAQEQLKSLEVVGSSGNGLVEVTMNGEKEILSIAIKPDCVDRDDIEGLQDLILAATQEAYQKIEENSSASGVPSLGSLPFGF